MQPDLIYEIMPRHEIELQLADSALNGSLVGYRQKINVEDIMTKNGFTNLQQVFDFVPNNTELHFSKLYTTNTELVISKSGIKLVADIPFALPLSGAGIQNIGTGNALRVKGYMFSAEGMVFSGNGDVYNFANGATGQHGIIFDGATVWCLNRCLITGNGGHGVYVTGGVWNGRIFENIIYGNGQDGVNSISTGTGVTQANGNNMVILGCEIGANGGNGVKWLAVQLAINNTDISSNNGAGVFIDYSLAQAVSGWAISIQNNYMEDNKNGQIRVNSTSSYAAKSIIIKGNYIAGYYASATGRPTSLIIFTGQTYINDYVEVGNNTFSYSGSYITTYLDGGNTFTETCKVEMVGAASLYVNLGLAKIETYNAKTRSVSGMTNQKSISWTTPAKSDNAFTNGIDTYFYLPVNENEMLETLQIYVTCDATTSYNPQMYLYEKDVASNGAMTTVGSYSPTFASGGNNLVSWNIRANGGFRVKADKIYYLRLILAKPSTGTNLQLNDLEMKIV